jgi:hypothetical protein
MNQALRDRERHRRKKKLAARRLRKERRSYRQLMCRRGVKIGSTTGGKWSSSRRRNAGSSRSWR